MGIQEKNRPPPAARPLRARLYEIIFEADTPAGRRYDIWLIVTVAASVVCVMLDSVAAIHARFDRALSALEWAFTALFTIDYVVRLYCVGRTARYAFSFFGVVDLLGVLPTYIGLVFPSGRYFVAIRSLRVLRVFRVLKLAAYVEEARLLGHAVRAGMKRIAVFLLTVLALVVVLGALMYVVEGGRNGFTSIPRSIYWAIVTLTTVGYGDISPHSGLGQALAAVVMIIGYSIIVVLTGIVTLEVARGDGRGEAGATASPRCPRCRAGAHDADARFCKHCGAALATETTTAAAQRENGRM